jgi:hypothetical protein
MLYLGRAYFSYVSNHEIAEIEERSQSSGWRELSELVNDLPYVAASPIFSECLFGVFESVTPKRFASNKFQGIFRSLSGASQTFINVLEYEGSQPFADSDVFIINTKAGTALNLSPLFLWGLNRNSQA